MPGRFLFARSLAALLLLLSALIAHAKTQDQQQERARGIAFSSPIRTMAFWHFDPHSTLQSRLQAAPSELIEYLDAVNLVQGFPGTPTAVPVTPDIARDFDTAISEMPDSVKALVAARLIGIFLVKDLGSTGMTDAIRGAGDVPTCGLVVIDISVFQNRNANLWATWKERSPFQPDARHKLAATIEMPERDDRAHAIQYILLHEFGHVVSIGKDLNPPWTEPIPKDHSLSAYPFSHLAWRVADDGSGYVSIFDAAFPQRKKVVFYRQPLLLADEMRSAYRALRATNFPTLYAATGPGDDFAESFANYVHVVLLQRPFSIDLLIDGKKSERYQACWSEPRCEQKRAMLEALLAPR